MALELADIFQQFGPAYRQKHASKILPSHRQAMKAIERCRTEVLGGQVYACSACSETRQPIPALTLRYRPGATKRFRLWVHQQVIACHHLLSHMKVVYPVFS